MPVDDDIELRFVSKWNLFMARCPEYDLEVGPFLDRAQAEDAIVKAVAKKRGHRIEHMPCFKFLATEYK